MDYVELNVGSDTYKLRLTVKGIVELERKMGYNPIQIFMQVDGGKLPLLTDLILILHTSMLCYNHGISLDKAYEIYDDYIKEGHTLFDLVSLIMDVFKTCGFVSTGGDGEEKN